jgi:hypothetical protein
VQPQRNSLLYLAAARRMLWQKGRLDSGPSSIARPYLWSSNAVAACILLPHDSRVFVDLPT